MSTISTNLSRSPSPKRSAIARARQPHRFQKERMSISPGARKRRIQSRQGSDHEDQKHPRRSRSTSMSYSSDASSRRRRRNHSRHGDRNVRRRYSSISPDTRGRDRDLPGTKIKRRRSRSVSRDRGHIARNSRSMTPASPPSRDNSDGGERHTKVRREDEACYNDGGYEKTNARAKGPAPPPPRRERSLSPYSKRLALTQAMNMGTR